jgi:hypothetical protein
MQFFHPPIFHSISPLSAFILPEESFTALLETCLMLRHPTIVFATTPYYIVFLEQIKHLTILGELTPINRFRR